MERREFSFTLPGDIYIRYQSFSGEKDLLRALEQKAPIKIDIGAVYNVNPAEMKKGLAVGGPEERELVFDIDMTDYDDVRTCCKGADVCKKCWKLMAIACKILNHALTDHFGFKHLLWVFSGRRGIHCWVCDESARILTMDERSAIAEYLSLVDGGKFMTKKCTLDARAVHHPLVTAAVEVLDSKVGKEGTVFTDVVIDDQKLLETPKQWSHLLSLCSNTKLREEIASAFQSSSRLTAHKKFKLVEDTCAKFRKQFPHALGVNFIEEVKLQFCYPRLDVNVSKGLNHLLKSPFVIHPKTGRVCVPFDARAVDAFDPKSVPCISGLISELEKRGAGDLKRTGLMAGCLSLMDKFLNRMESERAESEKGAKRVKRAGNDTDW